MSIRNPENAHPRLPTEILYLNTRQFYNILQEVGIVKLVFDVRSLEDFTISHARTAQHLPSESKHVEKEIIQEAEKDENFARNITDHINTVFPHNNLMKRGLVYRYIVLYGSGSHKDNTIIDTLVRWLQMEQLRILTTQDSKEPIVEKIFVIQSTYEAFEKRYPFICTTEKNGPAYGKPYPSEIIDDFLYLGDLGNSQTMRQISDVGITHILNMAQELPNKFEDELCYLKLGVGDTINDIIYPLFEEAVKFISKARESKGKVLVHCSMGVSRSATVTIAYLMKHEKITFEEALEIVKRERSIINPNEAFRKQLKEHQAIIHQII